MARTKRKQVGTAEDWQAGITVPIFFDEKTAHFVADFRNQHFDEDSLKKVKQEVEVALANHRASDWRPLLEVYEADQNPFQHGEVSFVGLGARRLWVAPLLDGKVLCSQWPTDLKRELDETSVLTAKEKADLLEWGTVSGSMRMPLNLPQRLYGNELLMAYTAARWTALQEIIVRIGELREKLRGLLGTEEGMKMLDSVGAKMVGHLLGGGK